jgi:hypothetical protein
MVLAKDYQPIAGLCLHVYFESAMRPVRDDMLVENDGTNCPRPVGMQCW